MKVKKSNKRRCQQCLLEFSSTRGQCSGPQQTEQVGSGFFFSVATVRSGVYGLGSTDAQTEQKDTLTPRSLQL